MIAIDNITIALQSKIQYESYMRKAQKMPDTLFTCLLKLLNKSRLSFGSHESSVNYLIALSPVKENTRVSEYKTPIMVNQIFTGSQISRIFLLFGRYFAISLAVSTFP